MSLHAKLSPEAMARLQVQKRNSTISSLLISILFLVLLGLILSLFLLPKTHKEEVVIVTYSYDQEQMKPDPKPIKETVKKKPSSPSSSVTTVITSAAMADVSIPVPEVEVSTPSTDFGADADFGSGWGTGSGSGSGSASFFNTKTNAQRVAYIIDYSASMGGKREQLMRTELARSVGELKGRIEYQLIFFAGPVWVAGDKIKGGKNSMTVVTKGNEEFDWISTGGAHGFKPKDDKKLQKPEWLKASSKQIKQSIKLIEESKLVYGTIWEPAIDMALRMSPKPDVIFFMTDGSCGGNMVETAERIGKKAKKQGVIINTVAMMQPQTRDAMLKMAEKSGGSFTLIKEDGKPYDKNGKPVKLKG